MLIPRVACWLSLGSLVLAGTIPKNAAPVLVERQATSTRAPDSACTNGPRTRNCWSSGFSIATDFDAKAPPAGKTVTYDLEITNTTANPDGGPSRLAMLINGQYPGPVIRAAWGDTLVINVHNKLQDNGTGIHWHGLRQLNTCPHDGVPGITECPIAPGKTRQYIFKCTQFGTSWYHSHWSAQYGEGVVGTMIIDGPATANYDEDLGTLPLAEWYYKPAFELNEQAQHSSTGAPAGDNILVNGKHINANGGGSYHKINVVKGKTYRLRIINTAVDSAFHVQLHNHPFTVITADFVPIKPWVTDQLTINVGQRYDVVFKANQTASNYWFQVSVGGGQGCGRNAISSSGRPMGAILHYDGVADANPTSTGVAFTAGCLDPPTSKLVPFVQNTVPSSVIPSAKELDLNHNINAADGLFRWTIDGSTHVVNWNTPSLETALTGGTDYGANSNVYEIQTKDGWYLWWIQTKSTIPIPHPIHLHGHDFYIVGSGSGTWDGTSNGLTLNNPTRRDTATLPGGGYLLLAFPADNPGLWVMHCHIAWHASQGLSVQFLERKSEIPTSVGNTDIFNQGCQEWNEYWVDGNHPYNQTDSGI